VLGTLVAAIAGCATALPEAPASVASRAKYLAIPQAGLQATIQPAACSPAGFSARSVTMPSRAAPQPLGRCSRAILELLDSAVLDSIPSDLRHAVTVEGKQICEALQCPPNIVSA